MALAKALTAYAKTNPAFTFKAGMVEGRVIDVKAINELATMPSKEEIFAKLLYVINAPAQRLVTAMNAVGRNLAVVVDQGVKENKFQSIRRGSGRLARSIFSNTRSLENMADINAIAEQIQGLDAARGLSARQVARREAGRLGGSGGAGDGGRRRRRRRRLRRWKRRPNSPWF